jgi:hypothetical protein
MACFPGQNFVFASVSRVTKLTEADDDISWTPAIMRGIINRWKIAFGSISKNEFNRLPTVVLDKGGWIADAAALCLTKQPACLQSTINYAFIVGRSAPFSTLRARAGRLRNMSFVCGTLCHSFSRVINEACGLTYSEGSPRLMTRSCCNQKLISWESHFFQQWCNPTI